MLRSIATIFLGTFWDASEHLFSELAWVSFCGVFFWGPFFWWWIGWLLIFGRGLWNFPSKSTLATAEPAFCDGARISQGMAVSLSRDCSDPLLEAAVFFFFGKKETFQVPSTWGVSPFFGGSACSLGTLQGADSSYSKNISVPKASTFWQTFGAWHSLLMRSKVDMRMVDGRRTIGRWLIDERTETQHPLVNPADKYLEICSTPS